MFLTMDYEHGLRGEFGPLWKSTFAVRDLKVWNDAKITHDLFIDGTLHCDNFAVPQVSFDRQDIRYTLRVRGEGLAMDDVALSVDEGSVFVQRHLAARGCIAAAQFQQLEANSTNFILGKVDIGSDANPSIVNIKGATNVYGQITAQSVNSAGDIWCYGTFHHSGIFDPPIVIPAHNHDDLYYRKGDVDAAF